MTPAQKILKEIKEQGVIRRLNVIVKCDGPWSPVRVSGTVLQWVTHEVAEVCRQDTDELGYAFLAPTRDGGGWWWRRLDEETKSKLRAAAEHGFRVQINRELGCLEFRAVEKAQEQALRDLKDRNEREMLLRMRGEKLFGKIAEELNVFFPEERTRETWVQICVALALAEGK